MMATLLCADRVWDGISPQPVNEAFVSVEAGVITAVGRQADLGSRFQGAHRIALPGSTLLPGLINGHVHLTFSASTAVVEDYLADAAAGPCVLTCAPWPTWRRPPEPESRRSATLAPSTMSPSPCGRPPRQGASPLPG